MRRCLKLVAVLALVHGATAHAADSADMKATVEQLQSTIKAQQARLDQLEAKMDMDMKSEMAKVARELADDAAGQAAVPKWLDNLMFYGDLRLRYQNDCADDDGAQVQPADSRRRKNRNRARFRLRFGFIKTWLDEQLAVGFRLASGNDTNPTSTNQTFTGSFNRKPIWIDRAWAKYEPKAVPGLTVIGGKMAVPLVHTDMIWDSDVNPEGFWGQYKYKCGPIEPFVNIGYFILEDDAAGDSQYDALLVTYQVGNRWKITDTVQWLVAATYYDWDHEEVLAGAPDRGSYECINLTNEVNWTLFDLPWAAYFDIVYNCDNETTGENLNQDTGYAIGVKVGKNKKKGDWSASYKYAYIEAFSTPGALNDSDFNGSNARGHVLRAKYNLTDFLTLGGSVFFLQGISDAAEGVEEVTTQVDIAWSF